jgi:hypothetical protein
MQRAETDEALLLSVGKDREVIEDTVRKRPPDIAAVAFCVGYHE